LWCARMRKEMRRAKRERMANMHATAAATETQPQSLRRRQQTGRGRASRRPRTASKKERRVIIMVVLLIAFSISFSARPTSSFCCSRAPASTSSFWAMRACRPARSLLSVVAPGLLFLFLLDLGYLTYILTLTSNFFIYYFFNSNPGYIKRKETRGHTRQKTRVYA
jgi:hypothetical protein